MKKFSKILSVALLVALVLSLGVANAFAEEQLGTPVTEESTVNITINRDDATYDSAQTGTGRTYTFYKIFSASYATHSASGGGYNDGAPGNVTDTGGPVAYTATLAVANVLGTYSEGTWTAAQSWFELTPIAGSNPQIFSVKWVGGDNPSATTVQAAADWLVDNGAYESSEELDANGATWTASVDPGYYVIVGSEGKNLIAATTDMVINEKNSYPTIDKQEKDKHLENMEATEGLNTLNSETGKGTQDAVKVAVGDKIDYMVTVHVPADANADIVVTDTMSTGLEFNDDVAITVDGTALPAGATYITATDKGSNTWTWQYTINATNETKGKDIVFTFTGTVTAAALTDTTKENDVELKYNNDHYVIPDFVEYETYFAGIRKFDPANGSADMSGVTFDLTLEDGSAVYVTYNNAGYYEIDTRTGTDVEKSNEVVTRAETVGTGANAKTYYTIKIRGLDIDETYILTETGPKAGYNPLSGPVTLILTEDDGDAFANADVTDEQVFVQVENKTGSLLPSTGGIGTTIFYVVGGVLVLAAIILLVTKKRMSE